MKVLIVDGHSVIFAWPELRKLHRQRMVLAREALVHKVGEFCAYFGIHGIVVFDGKGPQTQQESAGGVQIFFAAADATADQIIERLVARHANGHELTVVTSDLLEQQTVHAFGGSPISADTFLEQFEEARASMEKDIKKRNAGPWREGLGFGQ